MLYGDKMQIAQTEKGLRTDSEEKRVLILNNVLYRKEILRLLEKGKL